jgi:glycerophosphoryl diester phosphodiesterase
VKNIVFLLIWLLGSGVALADVCPLVIAHRGASGDRPEHTIEAYSLAIDQGADFIEPDLVPTRDGVLIARHENALAIAALADDGSLRMDGGRPVIVEATTDVSIHPEFSSRLTVKTIDGKRIGGWFSEDFTAAEVRTLRARERMPAVRPQNAGFDDRFGIPTFQEVLALAKDRGVGVYPELKHYTWFMNESVGVDGRPVRHDTVNLLLRELSQARFGDPSRIFIQSFEIEPLRRFRAIAQAGDAAAFPLVQLVGPADAKPRDVAARDGRTTYGELLADPAALKASHADVVGPAYQALLAEPGLAARLHGAGLRVHPFTLRTEPAFLPDGVSFADLLKLLVVQGIDGFFTDHPAAARTALGDCSTAP